MANLVKRTGPGMRLQLGASVLTAAKTLDTRAVKERLDRFARVHQSYVEAQGKVDTAESELRAGYARLGKRDRALGKAVEKLACELVTEDNRANPFVTFGAPSPGVIRHLSRMEQAHAVRELVAAVQAKDGVDKAATEAAGTAAKAVRAVEQGVAPIAGFETVVRDARRLRDAVAQRWELALDALKDGARWAVNEGVPEMYDTLFPPPARASGKKKPEPKTEDGQKTAPPPQTPAVTPTQTAA
jgi:hypothetical protein